MRLLVIGGTVFVGRHIVEAALARGHEVTLVHRGSGDDDVAPQATHLHADRNGDLAVLAGDESWDATVDVTAYLPRQVRALGDALGRQGGRGGRYVLISSISAYADADGPGVTEDAPLAVLQDEDTQEVTPQTYGGLKALCEYAAVEVFGTSTLIVRPTYVIGPHDPTGRFTYWVRRLARGGEVLAAGREQPMQTIDGRDLGDLVVRLVEEGAQGAVHVASPAPPYTFGQLLESVAAAVAPEGTTVSWVDPAAARAAGVDGRDLPLWSEGDADWVLAVDPSVAFGHGLQPRDVADSARDVLADDGTRLVDGVGLSAEREQELLETLRDR